MLEGQGAGVRYKLRVDGEGPFPDPWSRSQPLGVHGPSEVVVPDFDWTDAGWKGPDPEALVIYEVHVGTATPEGTFEALIPQLQGLRELGINTLELMPLASFPGARNWGYDGVDLFAPAARLWRPGRAAPAHRRRARARARRAHRRRLQPLRAGRELPALLLAALLHRPPPHAVGRRGQLRRRGHPRTCAQLVLSNVEMWIRDYHADGLRLDAAHAIVDDGTPHLLTEIAERARAAAPGRRVLVIAEDERNEAPAASPGLRGRPRAGRRLGG